MKRQQISKHDQRVALMDRLRDLAFKARKNPKSLTLAELDELGAIIYELRDPNGSEEPLKPLE